MGYDLGVDLGTTFVGAAVARDRRVEMFTLGNRTVVTPAVVYLGSNSELMFGDAADRQAISHPDRVEREFKRRLGDPTPVVLGGVPYQATSLLASLLRDVLTRVSSVEGAPPDRVALTHPANWGPYRRELFEEIPQLAGLSTHRTLTEPEAAAAYYATTRYLGDGDTIAVYDLGGGTFDATVLRKHRDGVELLGEPEGIERLGGIDFDEAILQWINYNNGGALAELDLADPQAAAAMAKLRQECVLAKEALSADTETTIPVLLPNRHFYVPLTRPEFEGMIRAPIESTIGTLSRALRSAKVEVNELSAVLLVGGSSRIPLIARMLEDELGRPTVIDAHPKHSVALGAAIVASGGSSVKPWSRAETPQQRTVPAPVETPAAAAVPPPPPPPAGPAPVPAPVPVGAGPAMEVVGGGRPPGRGIRRPVLWGALAAVVALAVAGAGFEMLTRGGSPSSNTSIEGASTAASSVPATTSEAAPETPAAAIPIPSVQATLKLKHAPEYVVASPSGRQLFVANAGDKSVTVLDTASNQTLTDIAVKAGPPRFLSFSPDGRFVYISIWDVPNGKIHAVSILDTQDLSITATIQVSTRPFLAAVTADGKQLWVPNHDSGTISIIDIAKKKVIKNIVVAKNPHWVAFSADGKLAYTANHESNVISVIDTSSTKTLKKIAVGTSPHSLALNPKRPMLMNVNYDSNDVSVIDTKTNKVTKTIAVKKNPQNIQWSPDGRFAYAVDNVSDTVSVISADDLKVTSTLPTGKGPTAIAVLPDGTKGYISNLDSNSLTVLDLSSN